MANRFEIHRRTVLQAGAVGALAAGTQSSQGQSPALPTRKSVIFIFLTGGISHIDTFDMKPDAPDGIRGEFQSIATRTTGVRVCEHLPRLAAQDAAPATDGLQRHER